MNLWEFLTVCVSIGAAKSIFSALLKHRQKLAEIRAKTPVVDRAGRSVDSSDLRKELEDLRDTTTRYDLSFDTALQRIESRVANLERRSQPVGHDAPAPMEQRRAPDPF